MMTVLPPTPRVVVYPDADTLAAGTAARLVTRITDVQSVTSPVHVVLTGGTVGTKTLAAIVNEPAAGAVDWAQVHFWWGDERFLVGGDPERNETGAREVFLSRFAEASPGGEHSPDAGP
jgi:6-phosphogluconolactonase